MLKVPAYIRKFMGNDFRQTEGVNASFDLLDFEDPSFYCCIGQEKAGCYIISATKRVFEYANGKKSPILYIGCSNDLYRRLHDEHYLKHLSILKKNRDYGIGKTSITCQMADKYQYMLYSGSHVDVFYCKGKQDEFDFESYLLASFYDYYRCSPVGNGARSYGKRSKEGEG